MLTVHELEKEVSRLSLKELERFRAWFDEFDASVWDKQFEADVESGKLDKIADQALEDFRAGRFKNYEAFYKPYILGHV